MLPRLHPLRCLLVFLAWSAGPVGAQNVLEIPDSSFTTFGAFPIPVLADHDEPLEAFTLSVTHDPQQIDVLDVTVEGTVTAAQNPELVAFEIFPTVAGFILGVFMDVTPPFDGQTVPPGTDQVIAFFTVVPDVPPAVTTAVELRFTDGVLGSPPVANTLVLEGGVVVGAAQGLELLDGIATFAPPAGPTLRLGDAIIPPLGEATVTVRADNPTGPVDAFTLAVGHDPGLIHLEEFGIDGTDVEALDPEAVVAELFPAGGTLSVVVAANPPFEGNTLPLDADLGIGTLRYECAQPPLEPDPPLATPIELVNDLLGDPPVSNQLLILGHAFDPALENGELICEPIPLENSEFFAGTLLAPGDVGPAEGAAGGSTLFSFFYADPDSELQGLQVAAAYDCLLTFLEFTFTLGPSVEEVGVEFVEFSVDNLPGDGDGCEFVLGILLDVNPPFEGQTLPPTVNPVEICSLEALISDQAEPGECLPVAFVDGVDGSTGVPVSNIVIIALESVFNFPRHPGEVCVLAGTPFLRGDVNGDGLVDVADGIFLLDHLFQGGIASSCRESQDVNDNGLLDLADAIHLISHAAQVGPPPRPPFPDCGVVDGADCDGYAACP